MAQHQDILPNTDCGVPDGLHPLRGLLDRHGRLGADRTACRQTHVGHEHVCAGLGHLHRFFLVEYVGTGHKPRLVRLGDHLDFQVVTHVRFFEILAEQSVDESDRGEVLDPRESLVLELPNKHAHDTEGIRSADARQHGGVLHDGQDLLAHLHDHLVGVAVGHHAREGTPPAHAVPPGIVDDDNVGASRFRALGGQTGAGARADDGSSFGYLCPQSPQAFVVGYGH